jgi:bifunctional DNA-binding transcriptional regulator/antitoxin component of YhaV-PrlF toxin-antitoxin module
LRNRYGLKPETEVVFEETPVGVLIKAASRNRASQLKIAIRKSRRSANVKATSELMAITRNDD